MHAQRRRMFRAERQGRRGAGYDADLAVFGDLKDFDCAAVFKGGKLVAEGGKALFRCKKYVPAEVKNTVKVADVTPEDFTIKLNGTRARAIGLIKGSLVTRSLVEEVQSRDGDVVLEGTDLLRLARGRAPLCHRQDRAGACKGLRTERRRRCNHRRARTATI